MNIVISLDKNFINPVAVLLTSLETFHKENTFFLISADITETDISKLKRCISKSSNIVLIRIDDRIFEKCPIRKKDHVSLATYYRLILPSLLSDDVQKVLYLDGDIICVDSLKEFYDTDISACAAAVIPDIAYENKEYYRRLDIKAEFGYFNAGVMLINLDYWRENNISSLAMNFIDGNPDKCKLHDQDALNKVLFGKVKYSSIRYDLQRRFLEKNSNLSFSHLTENIEIVAQSPCLIHFSDYEKPWHKECFYGFLPLWNYFWERCPVSFKKSYRYTRIQKLKFQIKKIFESLHIYKISKVEYMIDFEKVNNEVLKMLANNN